MDRWKLLGIDQKLRQAMDRGAVLTRGSAGAICWFDGGHSDSADPDTWKAAMLVSSMEGPEIRGRKQVLGIYPHSTIKNTSWARVSSS